MGKSGEYTVVQIWNHPDESSEWADVFAGLGAWTWAAGLLQIPVVTSVEAEPRVAQALNMNHDVRCCTFDVGNLSWVPRRPLQGLAASPPTKQDSWNFPLSRVLRHTPHTRHHIPDILQRRCTCLCGLCGPYLELTASTSGLGSGMRR